MLTHAPVARAGDVAAIQSATSRLLIVRHGVGRGPRLRCRRLRHNHCQPMFDDISKRWPAIGKRMSFWDTGRPQPDLSDVAAVVFMLRDPLRESHPDCYQDAVELARRARQAGARIVNSPESLSNTIKSTQSRIWRDAGLPTPLCIAFNSIEELRAAASQIEPPMIIKSDCQHSQQRMRVIADLESLQQIDADNVPMPGSLSPLVDTRSLYAELDPHSPYATHYHKKRAMVFGNHVCSNHVFFSSQPIVGCASSTFGHYRSLNPIRRAMDNARCKNHIDCDIDFHYCPSDDAETLSMAAAVLGVEFCAIDYSSHADGRIVLWEANPFFSLHRWPIAVLSRQRKLHQRTPRIHETAARFFQDLLSTTT